MSEIKLYGDVVAEDWWGDGVTLASVESQLETAIKDEPLLVRLNTFGGDVDTGFQIYAALRRFARDNGVRIQTRQDGYCASIGTVIFLAGDDRIGNKWSEPFVHNAWTMARGDSGEMYKVAAELERVNDKIAKFYSERTTMAYETARQLMDSKTFITSEECMTYGFYTQLEALETAYALYNYNNNKPIKKEMKPEEVKLIVEEQNTGLFTAIKAWFKKTTNFKNIIRTDANGKQIDFPDVAEGVDPVVGDTAVYVAGGLPSGDVVMESGQTFVFDAGTLTEIKEPAPAPEAPAPEAPADDSATVAAIAKLNADNEALKNQLRSIQSKLDGLQPAEKPAPEGTPKASRSLSEIRK